MYYTSEKTKELLIYHIQQIAQNWCVDDYIMGHFTSGVRTLIDFKEHKIANFPFRYEGYCRATVEELQELIDFKKEIPVIVKSAMNSILSRKIKSNVIFHSFDGERFYVRLDISEAEAEKRMREWKKYYRRTRKWMA